MSVVITREDLIAYAEVDYIIHHMNEKYIEKIPEKLRAFFSHIKDPMHKVSINPYQPLQSQGLKQYTLEIIALLHLKYWCEDEKRKQELYDIMLENQKKLDDQIREKYQLEELFEDTTDIHHEKELEVEKQDFSKPKVIQKYEQNLQNDSNDMTEGNFDQSGNQLSDNVNSQSHVMMKNFFHKIKEKILHILVKDKTQ